MVHRIVLNVIESGPKMSVRPHSAFDGPMENLSSAFALFTVPSVRRTAVQSSEFPKNSQYIIRLYQDVVMVWQQTPSNHTLDTPC